MMIPLYRRLCIPFWHGETGEESMNELSESEIVSQQHHFSLEGEWLNAIFSVRSIVTGCSVMLLLD